MVDANPKISSLFPPDAPEVLLLANGVTGTGIPTSRVVLLSTSRVRAMVMCYRYDRLANCCTRKLSGVDLELDTLANAWEASVVSY